MTRRPPLLVACAWILATWAVAIAATVAIVAGMAAGVVR